MHTHTPQMGFPVQTPASPKAGVSVSTSSSVSSGGEGSHTILKDKYLLKYVSFQIYPVDKVEIHSSAFGS